MLVTDNQKGNENMSDMHMTVTSSALPAQGSSALYSVPDTECHVCGQTQGELIPWDWDRITDGMGGRVLPATHSGDVAPCLCLECYSNDEGAHKEVLEYALWEYSLLPETLATVFDLWWSQLREEVDHHGTPRQFILADTGLGKAGKVYRFWHELGDGTGPAYLLGAEDMDAALEHLAQVLPDRHPALWVDPYDPDDHHATFYGDGSRWLLGDEWPYGEEY